MRQPAWDQYETALLIEAYINISSEPKSRKTTVSRLSQILRERAISNGKQIDNVYRNINGINLRLYEIQYLFMDNGRGITKTSRLFKNMVNLYKNDRSEFMSILEKAKSRNEIGEQSNQSESVDRRYIKNSKEEFYRWLISNKNNEPNEAAKVIKALKKAEDFAKEYISSDCKLFSATTDEIIRTIQLLNIDAAFIKQAETQSNRAITALRLFLEYSTNGVNSDASDHHSNIKPSKKKRIIRQTRDLVGWTVYRKVSSTESFLEKQKQAVTRYEHEPLSKNTSAAGGIICSYENDKESYLKWLKYNQHLSDATCRNQLSAILSAERYVFFSEYASKKLFGAEKKEAASTVRILLDDNTFLRTYGTYKSQLRKYLSYLELPERKNNNKDNREEVNKNNNQDIGILKKVDSLGIKDEDDLYRLKYPALYASLQSIFNIYYRPNGFTLNDICKLAGSNDKRAIDEILEHVSWASKETDNKKYYFPNKAKTAIKKNQKQCCADVKTRAHNSVEKPSEVLKQKILNSEYISIEEIITFARTNKISFSLLHYLNSFNETHFLIDGFTLADINYIGVNKDIARIVETAILEEIRETVPIADLSCITSFPEVNVPWNAWLIYSILKRWSHKTDVAISNSHFKIAFPLVAPRNRMANDFSIFPAFPHSGEIAKADDLSAIDDLIEDYLAEELGYEL